MKMNAVAASETRHRARGTLIELLVVIAIIGILASLLLPTLAQAKISAKKATCASQHKQLHLGLAMYCDDSDTMFTTRDGHTGGPTWLPGQGCD